MAGTAAQIKERRLARMRLGKATASVEALPSDPEMKVALVPLTEAEYEQCMQRVISMDAPDTTAGNLIRDRVNTSEIVYRAAREPDNIEEKMFQSVEEMKEVLTSSDISFLMDCYFEMSETVNPSINAIGVEETANLKKGLAEMDWSGLSGRQWYALVRFLLSLTTEQLPVSLLGYGSTASLITMSDEEKSILTVSENGNETIAKSVESQ